jgi:hypothetical protein
VGSGGASTAGNAGTDGPGGQGGNGNGGVTNGNSAGVGMCTVPGTPAESSFPVGYVMTYRVTAPCGAHRTCVECLAGPTGSSECQWCGNADKSGSCVGKSQVCPSGATLAGYWNGYCPEFCDQMDGTSCDACTKQVYPFDESCSWCPETQDCFNERAAQVGLQPPGYCGKTKGGPAGMSCENIPPLCSHQRQ